MSWGTRSDASTKDYIRIVDVVFSEDVKDEQAAQVAAAVDAAKALAAVVGRSDDRVVVTMSGHANPGHAPRLGWANECITVTVSAVPASE